MSGCMNFVRLSRKVSAWRVTAEVFSFFLEREIFFKNAEAT